MPIRLARTKNMWQGWSGGLTLMLMIISSPVVALADLIVDNGETYVMSADITNNDVTVGQNSTGTLLQGGYTNTVNNNLLLGENPGSQGTYNLSGGKLTTFFTTVGISGNGIFNQSGGTHEIGSDRSLTVGFNAGSYGVYTLSGGGLGSADSYIGFSSHVNQFREGLI